MKIRKAAGFLLSLCLLCVFGAALPAAAADTVLEGACGTNLRWTLDAEGVLTVSGTGKMTEIVKNGVSYTPFEGASTKTKKLVVEPGATSVCAQACRGFRQLEEISLPDSVRSVGDYAFTNCELLTELSFPDSVTEVGYRALHWCGWYEAQPDGPLYAGKVFYGFKGTKPGGTFAVAEGTLGIADNAFDGVSLLGLSLPESLTYVGANAFLASNIPVRLTLPAGVDRLGRAAFRLSTFTGIEITGDVTEIPELAFNAARRLAEVTLPKSVKTVGASAFAECAALTDVYYQGNEPLWARISVGEGNEPLTAAALHCLSQGPEILESGSFGRAGSTITWTLDSDGLVTITGSGPMEYGTVSLGSMTLNRNSPFRNRTDVTRAVLSEGLTSLGVSAFSGCVNLKEITLPESLTAVEASALSGCAGLTDVQFGGSEGQWESVTVAANNEPLAAATVRFAMEDPVHTHTPGEPVETLLSPAGCCVPGEKKTEIFCTDCGALLETSRDELPATGAHFAGLAVAEDGGILQLDGDGTFTGPASPDCRFFADRAGTCTALVLGEGVTGVAAGAFDGLEHLEEAVSYAPTLRLAGDAFSAFPGLETLIVFGAPEIEPGAFGDAAVRVFAPQSAGLAAGDGYSVSAFSCADGVLTLDGTLELDAYDFLDAVSVFCGYFGRIDTVRVSALRFENLPLYYTVEGKRTPIADDTLYNGEIRVFLPTENGQERQVTFNELCAGVADGSIRSFSVVTADEAHDDPSETRVSIIDRIQAGIKKVLGFLVSLMNRLFRLLKGFRA